MSADGVKADEVARAAAGDLSFRRIWCWWRWVLAMGHHRCGGRSLGIGGGVDVGRSRPLLPARHSAEGRRGHVVVGVGCRGRRPAPHVGGGVDRGR
jgi:hypothetical protein